MNILIFLISFIALVGAILIGLGYPQFGICFLIFSAMTGLVIFIWRFFYSNRDWKFTTSDDKTKPQRYFVSGAPIIWETPNQKKGMFYEIDLREEKRVIGVHFSCGETSKTPVKTMITFIGKTRGEVCRIERETKGNESSIGLKLKQALKTQYIRIKIKEPEIYGEQIAWRVEAVYIWVRMPFGFEYAIGKCWLDKL